MFFSFSVAKQKSIETKTSFSLLQRSIPVDQQTMVPLIDDKTGQVNCFLLLFTFPLIYDLAFH